MYTGLYSPQANTSERVNRSIITAIRSYLKGDQSQWDRHLSEIGEALRSCYHQTLKYSPYFSVFGQQMISNGKDYDLIKKNQKGKE